MGPIEHNQGRWWGTVAALLTLAACDDGGNGPQPGLPLPAPPSSSATASAAARPSDESPPADHRVTEIAAGGDTTCAVLHDGTVWCWGSDGGGELGWNEPLTHNVPSRTVPTRVHGVSGATGVAVAVGQGCAIVGGGQVRCWGSGQAGRYATGGRTLAVAIEGLSEVRQLFLSRGVACAVRQDHRLFCWDQFPQQRTAREVRDVAPVKELAFVRARTREKSYPVCLTDLAGMARCGMASPEQLAAGRPFDDLRDAPVAGVVSLAADYDEVCGALTDGRVVCWQRSATGEEADGGVATAEPVAELSGIVEVGLGRATLCARQAEGHTWCRPHGNRRGPAFELDSVARLSVADHGCAVDREAMVSCWGSNAAGQLGDGTRVGRPKPVPVVW